MALQPPPQQIRELLGPAYKWLTKLIHDLNGPQTATNTSNGLTFDGPNASFVVTGVTFADNSPIAGSVSWSACSVTYKGVTYSIPAGNGGPANPYISWQLSAPNVFQALGSLSTLGPDDFLLGVNTESGNPPQSGFFSRGFTLTNRTGEHFVIYGTGFIHFNKEGNSSFSALRNLADAVAQPAWGQIAVADGQGNATVSMVGNLGTIANPCGCFTQRPVTVNHLPVAPAVGGGERAFVTDATVTTFATIVVGGGANPVPVYFDGTNWRIG